MDEMDILVGFGFHPTDQEIIRILEEKRRDPSITVHAIFETNIYDFEPPDLYGLSPIQSDKKWCSFFCAPNYINADRKRVCRATKTGYWKLTGEGYPIKDKRSKRVIGFKRVLVFYERPGGSKEIKTNWVMHQFSATDNPLYKKDFVVCRVKKPGIKKRRTSTNVGRQQRKKRRVSTNSQGQPSHQLIQNINAPLATFNALNGCNGLVQSSFSALQSPINPEQESSSSGVSTNDYNGLVSPFSIVWEEDIPYECTSEEGRDSTPHFKSSKSISGFCGGDRSETDTEFTEWVHGMFEYNNIASVNYNAILNY